MGVRCELARLAEGRPVLVRESASAPSGEKVLKLNLGANNDDRSGDGFASVDIAPPADYVCDLRERWEWEDSSVEEVYAKDVAEHISSGYRLIKRYACLKCNMTWESTDWCPPYAPEGPPCSCKELYRIVLADARLVPFNGMIHFMNEAHRVLRPGGRMELIVPCYPGIAPVCDPTHGWPMWTSDTRFYFDERWNNPQGERGRLGPGMGITALFRTVGGRSGMDWTPIQYAPDAPERRKLFLVLEAVK